MRHNELSIIIPIQENSKGFPVSLIDVDNYFSASEFNYEIILCGNKKQENFLTLRKNFGAIIPNLKFIFSEHDNSTTLIREGMLSANGDYILLVDSERNFISQEAEMIISMLKAKSADVVCATPPIHSLYQRASRLFSFLSSDTVAIFGIERSAAQKILPLLQEENINFYFQSALLAGRGGYTIKEIASAAKRILPQVSINPIDSVLKSILTRFQFEFSFIKKYASLLSKIN